MFEPWAKGMMLASDAIGTRFDSLGPIPVGVRIQFLTIAPNVVTADNLEIAVTLGESPSRVLGDMIGQRPIFANTNTTLPGGPGGYFVAVFAGISSELRWAWELEAATGPLWVNVAVRSSVTLAFSVAFGLFGFRRVEV